MRQVYRKEALRHHRRAQAQVPSSSEIPRGWIGTLWAVVAALILALVVMSLRVAGKL
ncbi:hypothetical protein ACWENQ_10005 [Nonomuraea sp. NPDC004354]|uniref:hypothetical protein n=1 Tax=Nonomuraea sp. NPDC003804 TaxID=3154547 RepID=UPI0033A2134B